MKTKRLTVDAMFAAMYIVLSKFTLNMGFMKVTFESLPIIIGAAILGPMDGAVIGTVATFVSQLLSEYGLTATTPLWMLPYIALGLFTGLMAKAASYDLQSDVKKLAAVIVTGRLLVTAFNTLALYVDSKMFGYYSKAMVFGSLGTKIITSIVISVAFSALLPGLLKALKPVIKGK